MRIDQKYSHLNGEEYFIVHHKNLYKEIQTVIKSLDAFSYKTKISDEKTMKGQRFYSPIDLNKTFQIKFRNLGWNETRYQSYITTDPKALAELINLPYEEQRNFLVSKGIQEPIHSYL
jgi:hypothetical protein